MSIWLVGPPAQGDFAASAYDRIINNNLGGRPAEADPEIARNVIDAAVGLAFEAPVLHDVSNGGLGVALAEIAVRSQVGIAIEDLSGAELFDETPLRFIAAAHGNRINTDVPHTRIGGVAGDTIDFGDAGSIDLADAIDIWKSALPRRMR
jgi:phosphoribosylformylglycinamidine synthase